MDKFSFEIPDISRKEDALSYRNEFYEYILKLMVLEDFINI